jgi:hypothetical protein
MLIGSVYDIPILLSLGVIVTLLSGSVIASLLYPASVGLPGGDTADEERKAG